MGGGRGADVQSDDNKRSVGCTSMSHPHCFRITLLLCACPSVVHAAAARSDAVCSCLLVSLKGGEARICASATQRTCLSALSSALRHDLRRRVVGLPFLRPLP